MLKTSFNKQKTQTTLGTVSALSFQISYGFVFKVLPSRKLW